MQPKAQSKCRCSALIIEFTAAAECTVPSFVMESDRERLKL